ncbi:MAG: hypothetical protein NVSMB47_13290 [Polyangiales bacterium]
MSVRRSPARISTVFENLALARVGRVLRGKWELIRVLGVGGMATVYEGRHRNGSRVAVKMLHPALSASRTLCERFVREGYVANRVGHPGVARVLDDDVAEDDGAAFLVRALIDGVTLDERARSCRTGDAELLRIARDVLQILAAAHDQGVIHRDIKPDNRMIDGEGRVRVLDFGIAQLLEDEDALTTTGAPFGTPGFIAPEQALGRRDLVGAGTDIYGLGATLFDLASGELVHASEHAQELVVRAATVRARSVATCTSHLSAGVVALIDRATAYHPRERFRSAREMLREVERLERAAKTAPVPAESAPSDPPVSIHVGPRRVDGFTSVLVAGGVALMVGALGYLGGAGRMRHAGADESASVTGKRAREPRPGSGLSPRPTSVNAPDPAVPARAFDEPSQPMIVVGTPQTVVAATSASALRHPLAPRGAPPTTKQLKKRVIDVGY